MGPGSPASYPSSSGFGGTSSLALTPLPGSLLCSVSQTLEVRCFLQLGGTASNGSGSKAEILGLFHLPHHLSGNFETPSWWLLQCPPWKGPLLGGNKAQLVFGKRESCAFLPLLLQTALASLFTWIFITSGLVSDTQLRVCIFSSHWTLTIGLSVWVRKQVSLRYNVWGLR